MFLGFFLIDFFLIYLCRIRKIFFCSFWLSKIYIREFSNGFKNIIKYIVVFVLVEKYFLLVKLVMMLKIVSGFFVSKKDLMISVKVIFVFKFWKLFFVCVIEVNLLFCKIWICIFFGWIWWVLLCVVWKFLKYIIYIVKDVRRKFFMVIK